MFILLRKFIGQTEDNTIVYFLRVLAGRLVIIIMVELQVDVKVLDDFHVQGKLTILADPSLLSDTEKDVFFQSDCHVRLTELEEAKVDKNRNVNLGWRGSTLYTSLLVENDPGYCFHSCVFGCEQIGATTHTFLETSRQALLKVSLVGQE